MLTKYVQIVQLPIGSLRNGAFIKRSRGRVTVSPPDQLVFSRIENKFRNAFDQLLRVIALDVEFYQASAESDEMLPDPAMVHIPIAHPDSLSAASDSSFSSRMCRAAYSPP